MDALGLDTKNVRPWHQLSVLLVTLHYTTSSNSWSFQNHQTPRHCDCKIIIATFPSFQYKDTLEHGETNIQVLYGLILQVECQLFPFPGFLWIMPLGGYKDLVKSRDSIFHELLAYTLHFPWTQLALLPSQTCYLHHQKQKPHGGFLIFKEREPG